MQCEAIQDRLSAYLEGGLEAAERRLVEAHLQNCASCWWELGLLRRTVATLQSLEELEVPPRLTAAIQAGVSARRSSRWQQLASWLFFPLHIKVPLEAMALLLVSLGAVYLYRSAPELAQTPEPSVVTEPAPRAQVPSAVAPKRDDRLDLAARQEAAEKPSGQSEVKKERKVLEQEDAAGRVVRKSAPEPAAQAKPLEEREGFRYEDAGRRELGKEATTGVLRGPVFPDVVLRTSDPARATSRIAEIVTALGGEILEEKDVDQLTLTIPAQAYPQFLAGVRELGDLVSSPTEPPAPPDPKGAVTLSLRLVP